ncbi:MAG: hypothetical protein K9L64_05980 [Candidatus Izimaplasma sp.]|nr:hypothetical protein [Candidatus Izimaplasma bacterium]
MKFVMNLNEDSSFKISDMVEEKEDNEWHEETIILKFVTSKKNIDGNNNFKIKYLNGESFDEMGFVWSWNYDLSFNGETLKTFQISGVGEYPVEFTITDIKLLKDSSGVHIEIGTCVNYFDADLLELMDMV